jgi:hypothetical protein
MKYVGDSQLPEVTDQMLKEALPNTRPYTAVILKAGPKFERGPERSEAVAKIIWAHGKRNASLRLSGLMPIVCPVADGTDVCGICIFNATPEDADRIMEADPGVQAGLFTYEIHPTRAFPGSRLPAPQESSLTST